MSEVLVNMEIELIFGTYCGRIVLLNINNGYINFDRHYILNHGPIKNIIKKDKFIHLLTDDMKLISISPIEKKENEAKYHVLHLHEERPLYFQCIFNDQILIVGEKKEISKWNWKTGKILASIKLSRKKPSFLAITPNNSLALIGYGKKIAIVKIDSFKFLEMFSVKEKIVECNFSDSMSYFYLLYKGRTRVEVREIKSKKNGFSVVIPKAVTNFVFHQEEEKLFFVDINSLLTIIDPKTKLIHTIKIMSELKFTKIISLKEYLILSNGCGHFLAIKVNFTFDNKSALFIPLGMVSNKFRVTCLTAG